MVLVSDLDYGTWKTDLPMILLVRKTSKFLDIITLSQLCTIWLTFEVMEHKSTAAEVMRNRKLMTR